MRLIRWLHFSDLHLNQSGVETRRLRNNLPSYLESLDLVLEKGAASCVLVGMMDRESGRGEVRVHAWFPGKVWAEYPFVRTGTSCDASYPFQIPCGDISTPVPPEEANAAAACGLLEAAGGQFSQIRSAQS